MKKTKHGKTQNRQAGRFIRICLLLLFGMIFIAGAYISSSVLLQRRSAADAYGALRADTQKSIAVAGETPAEAVPEAVPETATEHMYIFIPKPAPESMPEAVSDKQEQKAAAETPDGTDEEKAEAAPVPRISMDFSPLRELCPDIRAWLFAEGASLDYPVVQTDNNEYYLSHLYNGEKNPSGTLFLDYRNTGLFTEQNSVVYGHRMKNGSMFGSLLSYKRQDFYDEYPAMLLYTPEGDYLIELVCGTVEDGNSEFVEFEFDNDNDFYAYIDSFRSRSMFHSEVEIEPEDKLISLCTCSYEQENARFMLIGKLTPVMEDQAPLAVNNAL